MHFIDLAQQQKKIKALLDTNMAKILDHGLYIKGPEVKALEESLCHYSGAKHAIACANGTDALQIALMALDLKPGDEVITTPFTFIATGEVIILLGLKPVFVDIDPQTYNIDANKIEDKITKNTRVILPVSLYGQCADMDVINAIAEKYNLVVIEDGAQSFGAEYHGKKSCNLSSLSTTSFFPSKPLGCYGDGGMVFTSDQKLADKLRMIANHGQEKRYCHTLVGINSRLDTLQAAVLLAKMSLFKDEVQQRAEIGARYSKSLQQHVKTTVVKKNHTSVYAQYTIEVENRDDFCLKLKTAGIPTAVHYPQPLHLQPVFQYLGGKEGDLPVTEKASKHVVSLPMHPYLCPKDQDFIVQTVKEAI